MTDSTTIYHAFSKEQDPMKYLVEDHSAHHIPCPPDYEQDLTRGPWAKRERDAAPGAFIFAALLFMMIAVFAAVAFALWGMV